MGRLPLANGAPGGRDARRRNSSTSWHSARAAGHRRARSPAATTHHGRCACSMRPGGSQRRCTRASGNAPAAGERTGGLHCFVRVTVLGVLGRRLVPAGAGVSLGRRSFACPKVVGARSVINPPRRACEAPAPPGTWGRSVLHARGVGVAADVRVSATAHATTP